jgi:hypothetical protein
LYARLLSAVKGLISKGSVRLPATFRSNYANPLSTHLGGLFAQVSTGQGTDIVTLESFTGAVYQYADAKLQPELYRFLAVISNMYRSFLDKTKRAHLDIALRETLPPLAVFQSTLQMRWNLCACPLQWKNV